MKKTLDVEVNGLKVYKKGGHVFVVKKDGRDTIQIRSDGERLCVTRLESTPPHGLTTEIESAPEKSYEVKGVIVGWWDDSTVVVTNETAPRCCFLITFDQNGLVLMDMSRGVKLMPDPDVEATFSAD